MNNVELAKRLAREIFELGDDPHDKAQRIEFKGGTYPDHETKLGGLCESSLAQYLEYALDRIASDGSGKLWP